MDKISIDLVQEADNYMRKLLEDKLSESIVFHTIDHARYVADSAEIIGKNSGLKEEEINLVKLCGLFHDAGYVIGPENHEVESTRIAAEFLASKGFDEDIIGQVKSV